MRTRRQPQHIPVISKSLPTMPFANVRLIVFLGFLTQMALSECPRLCDCKWKNGKESAICLNANLFTVPTNLDSGIQVIDLTGNNLSIIKHDEFSNAGLVNLQKVYLAKCRLKTLERNAFKNLINLVELDLSYNVITQIPSHIFDSIPELRDLKLNGNPITKIQNNAFLHIPQLIRLEITECKITTIEPKAFIGLEKSLEYLKLDKNKLTTINAEAVVVLQNLHGIELAGNPWNCSCQLRSLRNWMLRQNVPFGVPPACVNPKRLNKKTWDKLDLDEFACMPEIFAYQSTTHGIEGKNITMTCHITGIPEPNVRWMLRNKVIANLSGLHSAGGKKLYVVHLDNSSSDLTIFSADLQDAGTYVCAAENKAGKAEASVVLAMSKKPVESSFQNNTFLVCIIIGVTFVVIACIVVTSVFLFRKKKLIKWRRRQNRREDNYEKIEMTQKVVPNINGGVIQDQLPIVCRKNGEYSVVPCADTDQEIEEDEETVEEKVEPPKPWTETDERRWNSPEHLLDPEDLHIPRRTLQETRDKKSLASTSGIYNQYMPSTSGISSASIPTNALYNQPIQNFAYKQSSNQGSGHSIYASPYNNELSCLSEEQKYPDVIGNSSNKFSIPISKANSEGGSVTDITQLFCTLPRKKALVNSSRYKSTDSQSPLLPESRYNSSGGESSYGSQENNYRKMADIPKLYSSNLNRNRVNNISNSYLNLSREDNVPPELSSTPLLDITGLEKRIMYKRENTPICVNLNPNANKYDHHVAQLEKFLEEYRHLQKQLTKMKKDCDSLKLDHNEINSKSPSTPSGSDDTTNQNQISNTSLLSPNSNQSLEDSADFKKFEHDLTNYLLSTSPHGFNSRPFNS